jgi:ABC-type polar amino acid transport system ATPase subunit
MPMTLEVDPLSDSVRDDVARLAAEVGLDGGDLPRPVGALSPASRLRVRVARALALNPQVLLAEHPNASLPPAEVPAFAADYARVTATRRLASVTLTADTRFAAAVAAQVLTLQPATGELKLAPGWRRWFTGR